MKSLQKHIAGSLVAGIIAILPVGGLILSVGYLESTISSSGLSKLPFYFPGFGLIAAIFLIYLVGLVVTTFVGKWLWKRIDLLLDKLPALGGIYQTLKQILGYGEGKDAIFHEAVLIQSRDFQAEELGLVTNRIIDAEGKPKLVIFIPGAPNPTSGRLILLDEALVKRLAMPVNETLKALVSMGKTEVDLARVKDRS